MQVHAETNRVKVLDGVKLFEINVREDVKTRTVREDVKTHNKQVQRSTVKNAKEYEHDS